MAKEQSGTSLGTTSADTMQTLNGKIDLAVDLLQLVFYNNDVQPTQNLTVLVHLYTSDKINLLRHVGKQIGPCLDMEGLRNDT